MRCVIIPCCNRSHCCRPNVELLSVLLNGAARAADLRRCLAVMEAFLEHRVSPDRRVLLRLEQLRLRLDTLLIDRVRRGIPRDGL